MDVYLQALSLVCQPNNLLIIFVGVALGVVVGMLPGLTSTLGMGLLIPVTYGLDPVAAFLILGGMYSGSVYGGSISAILINIPGTPSAIATTIDGYPLCQQGRAGEALGVAIISSFFGGMFGSLVLLLAAPPLARIGLMFGPPEKFWVAVFGLTVIISVAGKSFVKGVISGAFGLILAVVGIDIMYGHARFTFGQVNLLDGIPMIPLLVGIFSVPEILDIVLSGKKADFDVKQATVRQIVPTWRVLKSLWFVLLRSSFIGTMIGIIPGAGTPIAVFMAYDRTKKASRNPEQFGEGVIEGVAAPEAANNAVEGGSLVPLLSLGIPGNAVSAIYLGAMMIHGLDPGPNLFRDHGEVAYSLLIGLFFANIFMLAMGLGLIKAAIRVLQLPHYVLVPIISTFSIIGSYAIRNSMFDVGLMFGIGLLGYFMKKHGFSVVPLALGFILGPIIENAYFQSSALFDGNMVGFFNRPISFTIICLTLFSVLFAAVREYRLRRKNNA